MKQLAYPNAMHMLPFDHRSSFSKDLLHFTGELTEAQHEKIAEYKHVVYDGFLQAAKEPKQAYAILVDDEYGGAILADARKRGYATAMPVEKSGQQEFEFDHDNWQKRIQLHNPSIVKVLVRYNPAGDKHLNERQLTKLKQLSDYCRSTGRHLLFELLVPPTEEQKKEHTIDNYDIMVRPRLMAKAIREIREVVHVDIWKIEGLEQEQWREVIEAADSHERHDKPAFIVLGRNASLGQVERWLRAAALQEQVIGFAVGRTVFYESLELYRDGSITRQEASKRIGDLFAYFSAIWMQAKQ